MSITVRRLSYLSPGVLWDKGAKPSPTVKGAANAAVHQRHLNHKIPLGMIDVQNQYSQHITQGGAAYTRTFTAAVICNRIQYITPN